MILEAAMARWDDPVPAEYEGTKLGATRTFRDMMSSAEEFNAYMDGKIKEAVKKETDKMKQKPKQAVKAFFTVLVLAQMLMILEYMLFLRYIH